MTVVQVHCDSASLEFHMREACPLFPKFTAFMRQVSIWAVGAALLGALVAYSSRAMDMALGAAAVSRRRSCRSRAGYTWSAILADET